MAKVRVTIVLPCLNEATGLRSLMRDLEMTFSESPGLSVTALFVDDGSTDDTWQVIQELAKDGGCVDVRGIRLRGHQGKAAAQAVGLRDAVGVSEFVAVMDSDGQHDVSLLRGMIMRSQASGRPVLAVRTEYRRGAIAALGTAGLRLTMRLLGVAFDPALSEFMVLPCRLARNLTTNSRLGFLPLVPLVLALNVRYEEQPVRILPRAGVNTSSRWTLAELWRKAIMHLLSDPWALLPRITLVITGFVVLLGGYGLMVGVWSMMQGTFLGIGSVLVALVTVFAALAGLMCVTLGVSVVAYQSSTSLAGQPSIDEEAG